MGGIPTAKQLAARHKTAREKLGQIKVAHDSFLRQWEAMMNEERKLLQELERMANAQNISNLKRKIDYQN